MTVASEASARAMCLRAYLGAIAVLALVPTPTAAAADRTLVDAVVVSTADTCLTHAAIVEHLTSWLERDLLDERLGVVLDVGESIVTLRLTRDATVVAGRTFEHLPAACEDRRAAVSLAIALAIDGAVLPALGTPVALDPTSVAPTPRAEAPPPPPRTGANVGVRLFAEGGALLVGLPEVAPLVRVGLALGTEVVLTLSASYAGGVTSPLAGGAVGLGVALGELGGCYARTLDPSVSLEGCVVVAAGAVHAEGRGFDVAHAVDLALVSGGARLSGRVALVSWLALRVGADAAFPFVRPRWVVESEGSARAAGAYGEVSVGASLGLDVTLDAP